MYEVKRAAGKMPMFSIRTIVFLVLSTAAFSTVTATVSYDDKAFIINGRRRILVSGSIHYPRSSPEMWPHLINKAKEGGLDVIETYVFWNGHEPSPGKYNFEGRFNLVEFIKIAHRAGLYVFLRIGPYVCAEWNFGGFPVWLKYVPGIQFRTDNQPFKDAMQGFVKKVVDMMKSERLFEPQGGPIIMSQIENEYGPIEWEIGAPGIAYTAWAAKMAVGLETGVPWIMCKHETAPDPIIDSCNGYYCEGFRPNKPYKPKMWTEAWTGWFQAFGGTSPNRPVEDLAFSVARFIQNNGSFFNYYMYHGGTNFGRTSGRFIATSYDYDAPLDEYGLPNEPKWGHLTNLHKAIKQCEPALVSSYPTVTWPGQNQEVHAFKSESGACAAFLSNFDPSYSTKVTFQNTEYDLPPWSISILPDCKTEVYNTAKITSKGLKPRMIPMDVPLSWKSCGEDTPSFDDKDAIQVQDLWEQVNMTRDTTDYLWYLTRVNISSDEEFLMTGEWPQLTVMSAGHALNVFINGKLTGTVYGGLENPKLTYTDYVNLRAGVNDISLLSVAVGMPNSGLHFDTWNAGVLGPVFLKGLNEGTRDLSKDVWSYKVGLKGESIGLNTVIGSSTVQWAQGPLVAQGRPLTWYKATFSLPKGNDPVALDMASMGKGQVWVNGLSIGRHWAGYLAKGNCEHCNYTGYFTDTKCQSGCNLPCQRWYHIPQSWLKPGENVLIVFEEWGGDPTKISLARRMVYQNPHKTLTQSSFTQQTSFE